MSILYRIPSKISMFSKLCHISLTTDKKVFKLIEGYVWTILKCLESVLRLLKKFCGIPSKIPCFPEKLVTGNISLRIRYDSYIGIFRPFGTISDVFEKSSVECSAEDSVVLCFSESVNKWMHVIYSTTHVTRRCAIGLCVPPQRTVEIWFKFGK